MPDVWLGRFSRWLEKLFNAKGGPLLVDVMPSIQSVISLQPGVEERYLIGWHRFAVVSNQPAVAANFSSAKFRNPAGSNVVAVLEQLTIWSSVADSPIVSWGLSNTDLATLVTLTFTRMDPRGQPQPTCIVSQTAAGGGPQAFLQRFVGPSNATVDFIINPDQQIPVLPGFAVQTIAQTANTNLITGFMWRERPLESSELA